MLAIISFTTIAIFMTAVMTGRLSAYTALILLPMLAAILLGHGAQVGDMVIEGVTKIAPTATLLLFAVLFFSVMIDAGLFLPLERRILRFAGEDPVRISVATAIFALIVSLDGDGATTILIVTTAFLPLYRKLGMNPLVLAVALLGANTVMNLSPWGGPSGRAAAALHLDVSDVFTPLVPVMAAGIITTLLISWHLGRSEKRRLALVSPPVAGPPQPDEKSTVDSPAPLGWRYGINLLLTLTTIVFAVLHIVPLPLVFMIALALGLILNFPDPRAQRDRLAEHAQNALPIIMLIFAAGAFTGILDGTGMLGAMAREIVSAIPSATGKWVGPVIAVLAIPLTFLLSNDAYYFGIVPVLAEVAVQHGVGAEEVARASLLAQPVHGLSPLVAAVYVITGILGVDLGEFQKFALKWALLISGVMIVVATLLGVIW